MGYCATCARRLAGGGVCSSCGKRVEPTGSLRTDGGGEKEISGDDSTHKTEDDQRATRNESQENSERSGTNRSTRDHQDSYPPRATRQPTRHSKGENLQEPPRGGRRQRRGQTPYSEQGQQRHRGQQPPPGGPPGRPDQTGQPDQPDDSDGKALGRREFLLGGAGAALVAGGGWWFFLRGPDGAKGVVDEYFTALESNDWSKIEGLYHENSPVGQAFEAGEIDEYTDVIGEFEADRWNAARVSIEGLYEISHDDAAERRNERNGAASDHEQANDIEAFSDILAILEEDLSGWEGLEENEEQVKKRRYNCVVVRDSAGDWSLWEA